MATQNSQQTSPTAASRSPSPSAAAGAIERLYEDDLAELGPEKFLTAALRLGAVIAVDKGEESRPGYKHVQVSEGLR
jgi:hypothetical protein